MTLRDWQGTHYVDVDDGKALVRDGKGADASIDGSGLLRHLTRVAGFHEIFNIFPYVWPIIIG